MLSRKIPLKSLADNALAVMGADSLHNYDFEKLRYALTEIIDDFINRRLPLRRVVLVASLLKDCHVEIKDQNRLNKQILNEQKSDGGWIDCEDSTWSLFCLLGLKEYDEKILKGQFWLENEKCENEGWGFCKRDRPCIPITAQVLYFLSILFSNSEAVVWFENEWKKDFNSPINLNYKAAWYLLAYNKVHDKINLSSELFASTIEYLINEQRIDGSWGPWRNHPAPGDCFITGICMAALSLSFPIIKEKKIIPSLISGIRWVKSIQLENGLFPTHYIEEGSAWIFFGWSKTLVAMQGDST